MDLTDEATYDRARLGRRTFLRAAAVAATSVPLWTGNAAAAPGPIVKPLPGDKFIVYGTNAEMRWDAMAGVGDLVPVDRFFVRNHTLTPSLSADTWRLKLFGTGLRGAPTAGNPVEFGYQDLLDLPAETVTARIECAGNGRGFFTTQQNQTVSGTQWQLGAVGVARWRGVRLATLLERAGLRRSAVDVLPEGLDPAYVTGGVNLGRVRRPLPIAKALKDVLVAYEMNGRPLPPDHGYPVRLVVPDWIGIASIKWLGRIEVSETPLLSPWNTQFYRLVGPDYPPAGELIGRQNTKSAFELPWHATLAAGRTHHLRGRSWSGTGGVREVEVSTDGRSWHRATPCGPDRGWRRWAMPWRPPGPGSYTLRARATDRSGVTQPDVAPYNTQGYLFGAVVGHPVTVS
jgi:DMSO/TMAO reductase YedYZ molybdopterin-dependent catalytic subunit